MNHFDAYNNQKKKILYCNRKNIKLIRGSELRRVREFREMDTGPRESRGVAAHRGCNRFMKGEQGGARTAAPRPDAGLLPRARGHRCARQGAL